MRGTSYPLASSSLEASGSSSEVKSFIYKPINLNNSYVGTLEPVEDLSEKSLQRDSPGQVLGLSEQWQVSIDLFLGLG